MANFFANPMIPRVTNPEPAGFNLIRQMLMNQMFQRNANPFGMNPGGQMGGNPLFPSGGRGAFDPYGGVNPGAFGGGKTIPGGTPGAGANPGMGGGGYKGRIPGGGSTGNNFMQMLQNFLQQYQGGGQGGGRGVPFRQGGDVTGGVGIGTRTPSPGTGGIEPGTGGTNTEDQGGGNFATPPFPVDTYPAFGDVGRMPISAPGGMSTATPPGMDTAPYTPTRGRPTFDGTPEYDGRPDVSKMMHAHQKMMTSVLPMLLQAPRVAAAAPSTTAGGPLPGYDGAMLTRPGGGYAPYDGMAPENAPSWTPLAERSGGTGLNLSESNTPNSLPASRDVPPLPRPGYDGNDDAAYAGFRHVRAPNVAPRPSMGVRPPMNAAAGLQRILAGQAGANRRGGVAQSRVGSKGSAFDGSMEQPRGPAPSYDASGSNVSSVPIGGDPTGGGSTTGFDTGGSASPYPTGAQTGGQAMYPWLMPYTGQRTATMSPYEIQGLEGMSDFVGGGMGLGGSRKYLDDLLSGKYIGSDNPYMADFQKGAQTLKESEDAMARQRIGSSMAAGGNALSGARIASEQQYQNTSDAQFQKMLAEMQMQNLARERALQQGGVGLSGNLAGEQLGGLSALMNAGAVPRGIQQGDFNAQYGDWLRQIGAMNESDKFQQNLATQMLHTSPGAYQPGYGTSAAEGIAALLAGSGAAGGIGDLLKKLFSGGGSGGSKGGGGGGGNTGGGGGGGRPGQDASGNTPEDPEYNPATDPANWGDMGYGTYGPDLPGNYNPDTGEWEQFGPNLPPGYDPETGGYDMGEGQYGPPAPEDYGLGDFGDWGDYFTSGNYDYPTYGDTSGDWGGWG